MTTKKRVFLIGAGVVVLGGFVALGVAKRRQPSVEVRMEKVQRRDLVSIVTASGRLQPQRQVDVSSDITGRIISLPVREGDYVQRGQVVVRIDPAQFEAAVERSQAFLASALAIGTGESAAELPVQGVSADFWRLFEMRPALGRFFAAGEDSVPETTHVAVLGCGFWRSRFGGSAGVLGQRLRIGRNDYTVVGVAPRGFQGADLSAPVAFIPMTAIAASEETPRLPLAEYRSTYGFNDMSTQVLRAGGIKLGAGREDWAGPASVSLTAPSAVEGACSAGRPSPDCPQPFRGATRSPARRLTEL